MILTSTTETVDYSPPWYATLGKPGPVFKLRAGSVIERGQLEAELAGPYQARRVFGYELEIAMREGVTALLAEDPELDRVLAAMAAEADLAADNADLPADERKTLPAEEARLLDQVRGILAQHWPDYAELVARAERRRELVPVLAFRRFCTGWTGIETPYRRGPDGFVADAALKAVEHMDLLLAGNKAYQMLTVDEEQAGNSARPDVSGNGPRNSDSDEPPAAAGSSPAGSGRKTRGSRSRR